MRQLAVVILLGSLVVWRKYFSQASSTLPSASLTASQPAVRSVAVLPFAIFRRHPGDDSWGIGMTDAIITRLASLQNLAVRPTSSVSEICQRSCRPAQAAQELGVDSVLDGTYQRVSGLIRVSVQLVDRENRAMRWAEHYDLRADEMLKFQDEVAQKVVEGLRVQVSGQEQESLAAKSTSSAEAYNLYLQARFYQNEYFMRTETESLHQAQHVLQQAVEIDRLLRTLTHSWHICTLLKPRTSNRTARRIWRRRRSLPVEPLNCARILWMGLSPLVCC